MLDLATAYTCYYYPNLYYYPITWFNFNFNFIIFFLFCFSFLFFCLFSCSCLLFTSTTFTTHKNRIDSSPKYTPNLLYFDLKRMYMNFVTILAAQHWSIVFTLTCLGWIFPLQINFILFLLVFLLKFQLCFF